MTPAQQQLVMGGETCMWGESIDAENILPVVFPRSAAASEVLWSPQDSPKIPMLSGDRLQKWVCRVNFRGISSTPVSVGYLSNPALGFCNPY